MEFLKLKASRFKQGKKTLIVKDIELRSVKTQEGLRDKVEILIDDDSKNQTLRINDAWVVRKEAVTPMGLWFSTIKDEKTGEPLELTAGSTLAKLLKYYNCESLEELKGKEVELMSNEAGYYNIVACNLSQIEEQKETKNLFD